MNRHWISAALGAVAGALLVLALVRVWQPAPVEPAAPAPAAQPAAAVPEPTAPSHRLSAELEMARSVLAAELAARIELEAEVSRLREELGANATRRSNASDSTSSIWRPAKTDS